MNLRPELDASAGTPLYRQLHAYLKDLIRSGRIPDGERLPPTRELAGQLGLNRTTVSAAYELLEGEGLISGQVGRGSFVTGSAARAGIDWDSVLDDAPAAPPRASAPISFTTAQPPAGLFPLDDFRAACNEVMASGDFSTVLQLGSPGGYEPLREHLLAAAREEGTARAGDDIMITSGCQQGLDLLARALVRPGDRVAVEDPVYPGLKNLLREAGAQLAGIPVGAGGIDVDAAAAALQRERPRMLVVTSNFQNPTGATVPLAARHALLRAAAAAGVIVVENDTYGELRYRGEAVPAMKQLDESGDAILLRSFSKISFPGLRVGWVLGPRPLIARLMQSKQTADLHTDQFSQAVLLRFATSGRLARHRKRMIAAGLQRLDAALAACASWLPAGTRVTRPEGGMNLWVRLPGPLDAAELLPRAQREGAAYAPGRWFEVSRHDPGALRLCFAALTPEEIDRGIHILGKVFQSELARTRSEPDLRPAPALV